MILCSVLGPFLADGCLGEGSCQSQDELSLHACLVSLGKRQEGKEALRLLCHNHLPWLSLPLLPHQLATAQEIKN